MKLKEEITVFRCKICRDYDLAAMNLCYCEKADHEIPARIFVPKKEVK